MTPIPCRACRNLPRRFDKARAVRGWDEKRLLRSQRLQAAYKLLIIDELGYVPLSTIGAELLSLRYERDSTIVSPTCRLPVDQRVRVREVEGALLDRLTPRFTSPEINGDRSPKTVQAARRRL